VKYCVKILNCPSTKPVIQFGGIKPLHVLRLELRERDITKTGDKMYSNYAFISLRTPGGQVRVGIV
jgi:hypothetical protein